MFSECLLCLEGPVWHCDLVREDEAVSFAFLWFVTCVLSVSSKHTTTQRRRYVVTMLFRCSDVVYLLGCCWFNFPQGVIDRPCSVVVALLGNLYYCGEIKLLHIRTVLSSKAVA